jgi:hypothetical protein
MSRHPDTTAPQVGTSYGLAVCASDSASVRTDSTGEVAP